MMPRRFLLIGLLLASSLAAGCAEHAVLSADGAPLPPQAARLHYPEAQAYYHFTRSGLFRNQGRLDQAIEEMEKASGLDPDDAYLLASLGRLRLENGDRSGAVEALKEALIKDPGQVDAYLLLGGIHFSAQEFERAIPLLAEALRLAPRRQPTYIHLGLAYVGNGELQKAIETFRKLLEINPESIPALLNLARAYRQFELDDLAGEYYQQVQKRRPGLLAIYLEYGDLLEALQQDRQAEELYRKGLDAVVHAGPLYHRLARLMVRQQRLDEALSLLEGLLKEHPDDLEAWRKVGLLQLELKQWQQAAENFRRILEQRPDLPQVNYYLGTALEQQQKWQQALDAFDRIPAEAGLYPDALFHRSFILHQMGDNRGAIGLLEELIGRGGSRAEFYDYLASLYEDIGNSQRAIRVLEDGLERFPEEVDLLYHRGVAEERSGDRAAAMATMAEVFRLDPNHAEAMNYVAYGYAEAGTNLERALELVNAALKIKHAPHILDTLGWVYYRLGRLTEARHALEEAVDGLPEDAVVLEHLGDVYHALGEDRLAEATYARALKLAPDTPGLAAKLRGVAP